VPYFFRIHSRPPCSHGEAHSNLPFTSPSFNATSTSCALNCQPLCLSGTVIPFPLHHLHEGTMASPARPPTYLYPQLLPSLWPCSHRSPTKTFHCKKYWAICLIHPLGVVLQPGQSLNLLLVPVRFLAHILQLKHDPRTRPLEQMPLLPTFPISEISVALVLTILNSTLCQPSSPSAPASIQLVKQFR
jgi:hypothetical protein